MHSVVPEGHPGDLLWRLPVWRTLLRLRLVSEAQLESVNALAKEGGLFLTHLATLGMSPEKLLSAIAIATGLPAAARHEVRRPKRELADGLDGEELRALLATPFKRDLDLLHLAFAVPMPKERLGSLPPHRAYVGLESDIREGIELLFPKGGSVAAFPQPSFDSSLDPLAPVPATDPGVPDASGNPSTDELKRAGLTELHVLGREELLGNLKRLKWPAAGVLALILCVKGASWIIDYSRDETAKRGAELRTGMVVAAIGSVKAQPHAMRPGGGADPAVQQPHQGSFDAVSNAMADLDVLMRRPDLAALHQGCRRLADELRAYAPMAPSMRQMGPLMNLSTQTRVLCEQDGFEPPLAQWLELRERIMGVLKGEL